MSSERDLAHCLFCASPCCPSFTIIEGNLTRVKSEERSSPRGKGRPSSSVFLEEEENFLLAKQLKVIFLLKNILNIKDEKLIQFLGRLDGQLSPEFWIRLCNSCGSAVKEFYETFKEVSRLQKKLMIISNGLKAQIEETKDAHEDDEVNDEEETSKAIWKEVREAALVNMTEVASGPVEPPSDSNQAEKHSAEILIDDGDIHVEWDAEDGSLLLDVPDLSSLRQILGLEPPSLISNCKVTIKEKPASSTSQQEEQDTENSTSQSKSIPPNLPPPSPLSAIPKRNQTKSRARQTCKECPYSTRDFNSIKSHLDLHKPGVETVTCSICNWVVHPDKLRKHFSIHHPTAEGKRTQVYYKCPDCGALMNALVLLRAHQKLHENGEGVTCPDCGWLTTKLAMHITNWHPQEGTIQAEIRKRTANYRIVEVEKEKTSELVDESKSDLE